MGPLTASIFVATMLICDHWWIFHSDSYFGVGGHNNSNMKVIKQD
jgi:hypothetical protein